MGDLSATFVTAGRYWPETPEHDSLGEVESTKSAHLGKDQSPSLPVKGMYPLLDLITEKGSGGLVDKIVIAQQSLQEFVNALSPGAYSSITNVNFKILDNVVLKPLGIYGSKEEIVRFLCEIKAIDDNTAKEVLVPQNRHAAGSSEPVLRSGLYIVRSFLSTSEEQAYVVYWPEDTTWDDRAASPVQRNRVTFMRYLSKLCDQLVCLLSSEHSRAIAWVAEGNDDDSDGASSDSGKSDSSRFFYFEVARTKDQEENVVVREGFMMSSPLIVNQAPPPGWDTDLRAFCPALLNGEKVQGFMTTTFVPARTIVKPFSHDSQTADQIGLRLAKDAVLCLPEKFDSESSKSLITVLGLRTRFRKEYEAWNEKNKIGHPSHGKAEMHAKIEEDPEDVWPKVRRVVVTVDWLRDQLLNYPQLERQTFWARCKIRRADLEEFLNASEFQFKKKRIIFLQLLNSGLQNAKDSRDGKDSQYAKDLEDAKSYRPVVDNVLKQKDEKSTLAYLETFRKDDKGIISRVLGLFRSSSGEEELWQTATIHARSISDFRFLSELKTIPVNDDLHRAAADAEGIAYEFLKKQVDTSVSAISRQILWSNFVRQVKKVSAQRSRSYRCAGAQLSISTISRLGKHPYPGVCLNSCLQPGQVSSTRTDTYYISGRQESLREAEIEHRIHLLHLHTDERQKVQLDPTYVPTPILEERLSHSFRVSPSTVVKYAHLLEGGRILVGLVDPQGNIEIYVESLSRINAAIQRRSHAKLFHRDKVGETCLFVLDESKRILAVYSPARMQLHIFSFEDEPGSLRGMGPAIDLLPFYNNRESIVHACFVHCREEILFVDSSAQARIFSLTMLQPKPASLQLPQVPRAIYSSPDGSCVFVVQEKEGVSSVTAYHWTTFASTDGIPITLPDFPVDLNAALLTSIVNRNNTHLIGLDVTTQTCRSIVLDVTCKATEFTFQAERLKASTGHGKETSHNCLIDCHEEVWTRFPVVAAVKRRTITSSSERQQKTLTFVTDDDQHLFSSRFSEMVRNFTETSRKPTGDVFKGITVSSRTFTSFARTFLSSPEWSVSRFRSGEWLADLLCLIPIHIAITYENRFVPLKDGVLSAQLETSLLGAEVNRIVDSLSIGWYESIFQSYWASKPVKVVSSMGEQSVGKSFTLNHLVDTSFAGSAMRTTEGVWLSVSPTDDALIVALDFEGVHSLERSKQEDTLLVLFNTAISNLVLFRNNFALSRDITSLFQSFQSSASILDPVSNPSLFQSTLLVIIKDVLDSDAAEVAKEFSLKFQKIVEDEQDSNFITRLHAGELKIIPWPVIESKKFYKLFNEVKKILDEQPTSHRTAGEFLLRLKTLMAKLKANDWGAMSQTMAIHRANSLLDILTNAFETGFSRVDPEPVPLKNFDADFVIEAEDTEARFILPGPDTPVADHESRLATLRESWDRTNQRQHIDDSTWHSDLAQYLTHLVNLRVAHVENWLESNIQRFESGHASIEELRRTFRDAVIDLRVSVELCRSRCDSCNLVCVRSSRLHGDGHDCLTSHKCIHDCTFCERDAQPTQPCGQTAGHPGDHICRVGTHLCAEPCEHSGKRGCEENCVKPIEHKGDHLCSALVHMCGQPCRLARLRLPNGKVFTCPGTCRVPIDKEHGDHECENRECPASCQLCDLRCTRGHLHGFNPGEYHLCGTQHDCRSECSAGICEIQTKPETIEGVFTGRYDIFQYTKVSPLAKPLPCAKKIKPGEVKHPGPHIHSNDEKPFHYCNSRCKSCGYLCTLPFGHPQQEHETSHGSMSQTKWAIDGPDDTSFELGGHEFSSNDEGGTVLCSLVCKSMGRHVHVDFCRGFGSHNSETQHVNQRIFPDPYRAKDWITHALHWRRTDPYSREDQANFAKWYVDSIEHTPESGRPNAQPSGCTLALFHTPVRTESAPPGPGYVSNDGHHFACKNPGREQAAFHVIFAIDLSKSMARSDRRPLPNAAGTPRIAPIANNRLGAVISSLYSFWTARQAAVGQNAQTGRRRRDAYSIIFFSRTPMTCVENDFTSSPDELLTSCLRYKPFENEDYTRAIEKAQAIMTSHWSTERSPVLIFLSDGESHIGNNTVSNICRAAASRGMPLSFHAVSFGPENRTIVLREMVETAQEVENGAAGNSRANGMASSFTKALDTVKLTATFQGLANSLTKTRGHLLASS
ncbi:hypothetical protein BJY52DRAFT_1122205 [Lactarius psammicola]|nr:hypothetical protein BJY52DRAFT_1122205 [Lactarius psammicola]